MARTKLNAAAVRLALEQRREQELIAEQAVLCTASFRAFVESAWPVIEPRTPFMAGWHIDAICEHLEGAGRGEIKRLVINVPPRHMKTITVSVMWPAWWWTFAPQTRFLTASYGAGLAERDAVHTRACCSAPSGTTIAGPNSELKADVNRTNRYENTHTGYRRSRPPSAARRPVRAAMSSSSMIRTSSRRR